jgi:hypothetical protein
MGGMWGCRRKLISDPSIWSHTSDYGVMKGDDQLFLNRFIYPRIVKEALIHDSYFSMENFSKKINRLRNQGEFIGEVFNDQDEPDNIGREYLLDFEKNWFKMAYVRYISRYYKFEM